MIADIEIRQFDHESDAEWGALELYRQQFAYTRRPQFITPFDISMKREIGWTQSHTFKRWVAMGEGNVVVGSCSMQIVGQTPGFRDDLDLIFGNIAVLPQFRRVGIGSRLLELGMEQAKAFATNHRLRITTFDDDGVAFA